MSDDGGLRPKTLIDKIFWHAGAMLMLAMAGVMLYVVTARYFFNRPPLWSEDVPRTIFVWMVFVTLGLAIKLGLNIRVTTLTDMMPRRLRFTTELIMNVLVLVMIAILIWFTIPILRLKAEATMLSTGWSEGVLVVPMVFGFMLAFAYQVRQMLRSLAAWRSGTDLEESHQTGAGMG